MLFRYTMLSEPKADSGHHTKGALAALAQQQYRWGRRLRRRPHRYCCFPFVWCPKSALGSLSIVLWGQFWLKKQDFEVIFK